MAPASSCVMAESEETTDTTILSSHPPVRVVGPSSVGASVAAATSVGASVAACGASVAVAAGAQATSTMLAITRRDNKVNILRILYSPHIYYLKLIHTNIHIRVNTTIYIIEPPPYHLTKHVLIYDL
jgi:hypothetical protein